MAIITPSPLQGADLWHAEPFFVATLPLPPGINQSYKIIKVRTKASRYAHTLSSSDSLAQFKHDAHNALLFKRSSFQWDVIQDIGASNTKIPLSVELDFYFVTLWTRDIDGGIKAALDVSFDFMGLNDNLIVDLRVGKYVDRQNPRCEIKVKICLDRM